MKNYKLRKLKATETELIEKLAAIEKEIFGDAGFNRFTIPMFASWGRYYILCGTVPDQINRDCPQSNYENCYEVIAGTQIIKIYNEAEAVYIAGFWVQKRHRNKGIGKKFLNEIIDKVSKDGIKKILLTADPVNEKTVNFYKDAGFKVVSLEKDYYGKGNDRLIMKCEVRSSKCEL